MTDLAAFFLHQAQTSASIHFVYDVSAGQVMFVNAAYKQVLQGSPEQVNAELPALLSRLHPDDQKYLTHYWRLWVRGQMHDEVELRLRRPDQSDQWFALSPCHQQASDGTVLLGGLLRDISQTKSYEKNADRYNSRKNATLEILSHDLSNAFLLVQQIGSYLQEELSSPTNSRVSEMLHVLESTSQESVAMIREFVQMEFLTSANTDLRRSRVDVKDVLREPLDELQRTQRLLGHEFTYSLPAEPLYAELDVNKFTQVLTNLIGNAIKFTPDGGQVSVLVEPCPGCLRIHVRDTGIGIPAALQPVLFDRFTKARRPGLRGESTTGLGLALCKMIVEWHQGTISVKSIEGQGSTFTVEIPLAE